MTLKFKKSDLYALVIFVIIHLMMFSSIIKLPMINYIDEVLTLFLFVVLVIKKGGKIKEMYILYIIISFIFLGFIYSITSELTAHYLAAALDAFSFVKWPIMYVTMKLYISNDIKKRVVTLFSITGKFFIVAAFAFGVMNFFYDMGMTFDIRHGFKSFKFIFNNPAALNEINLVYFCCIAKVDRKKIVSLFFAFFAMCTLLTFRSNGIATVGVYILLLLILKFRKKLKLWHLILPAIAAIGIAWQQVQRYFMAEHVRSIMLIYGIDLAKERFPFGYGFATFGSDQAYKVYSDIYKRFSFNLDTFYYYRNDNFWPMVLGQIGVLGAIIYLILLMYVLYLILKSGRKKSTVILMVICWVEMFISSTGNAIYTSVGAMIIFGIIALLNYDDEGLKNV